MDTDHTVSSSANNDNQPGCTYKITVTEKDVDDAGRVVTYGITTIGCSDSEKIDLTDVSTDKKLVESIITALNDNDVSCIHLFDIIEDIIP